jgi:hypothetical protein
MKNNVDANNIHDVEFSEFKDRAIKALEELVMSLREDMKTKPKDFVFFKLSEVAKETKMDPELHRRILFALDNPDKEFTVSFAPKQEEGKGKK